MQQRQTQITVHTRGQGLYEFTREAVQFVSSCAFATGMLYVYCRHTSASLLIQENADADVQRDLTAFFRRLVPDGDPLFRHTCEGPDDMPAHVKSALTQTTLTIPIAAGAVALGTWQGLFLFEHRAAAHTRQLILHAIGG